MHTRHLAILTLGLITPILGAAEWTRFRGPDGLGTASDKTVPVSFGPSENVFWKVAIPGRGNSSPIVSKGKVFVQTAKDTSSRSLVCIDVKTGKIDWAKELKGSFAKTHELNSLASSTPAAD